MSCIIDIRLKLFPNSDAGGDLTYEGYNASSPTGPFGVGGGPIPSITGDTLLLNSDNIAAGYYQFKYEDLTSTECDDPQVSVLHIAEQPLGGTPTNLVACVSLDSIVPLAFLLFGETQGGEWTVNPGSDPMDPSWYELDGLATFSFTQCDTPGVYVFDYTVTYDPPAGFEEEPCALCTVVESVTITVLPETNAGDDATIYINDNAGSFNLIDQLLGLPDLGGEWTELTSTGATISNGDQGTVNLDAVDSCYFQFQYETSHDTINFGSGCDDTAIVTIYKFQDYNLTINQNENQLSASHDGCGQGPMTYQWFEWNGSSWDLIVGATSQTYNPPANGLYRVEITCGNCVNEATIDYFFCSNDPQLSATWDDVSKCLDVTKSGTINSPIATDVVEWRRVGDPTWNVLNSPFEICGCDVRETFTLDSACLDLGNTLCGVVNTFNRCDTPTNQADQFIWRYGNGTSNANTNSTGGTNCAGQNIWNIWNNRILGEVIEETDAGTIRAYGWFEYDGAGTSCSDITHGKADSNELFYDIEIRRTVTYTDGCDPDIVLLTWNRCSIEAHITHAGTSLTANVVVKHCTGQTYYWEYFNGSTWVHPAGYTDPVENVSSFGNRHWRVTVTCGLCTTVAHYVYVEPCSVVASISESGGVLTGSVTGCTQPISLEYWTFTDINDVTNFVEYGNTTTLTDSGTYTYHVQCGSCTDTADYIYNSPCSGAVTIVENGDELQANVTGCGTNTISYEWEYSSNGSPPWTFVSNAQSITPNNSGFYRVTINCSDCTDTDTYEFCDVNVFITENNDILIANVTGCGGTPTYVWERDTGGGNWVQVGTNQTYAPSASGDYRVTVTCDGCNAQDEITWTANCTLEVWITVDVDQLNANETGCSGSMTWTWEFFDNGSWVVVGTGNDYDPNGQDGLYRLTGECSDGCTDQDTYIFEDCGVSVFISESNDILTANVSGCGGNPITYQWEISTNSGATWSPVGTNSPTYTPAQTAWYRVTVTCDGCSASDIYQYQEDCISTVTIIEAGANLQANFNCGGATPVDFVWQYSASGTGWSTAIGASNSSTHTPQNGEGYYRVIVYCGGVPLCPSQDTYFWSPPCGGSVVIADSSTPCTYEIFMEHPDNGTNNLRATLVSDSTEQDAEVRVRVTSTCDGELVNDVINSPFEVWRGVFVNDLDDGVSRVQELRVMDASSGTWTQLVLNPTTTPYLTNNSSCGEGTVAAADLIFDSSDPNAMELALFRLIKNALCDEFGAVEGVDYDLQVLVLSSGFLSIYMKCKHNPSGQWIGFTDNGDTFLGYTNIAGRQDVDTTAVNMDTPSFVRNYLTPCGYINKNQEADTQGFVDLSSCIYDTIVLNSTSEPLVQDGAEDTQETCTLYTLTSSVSDCPTSNVFYQWQYREDAGEPWANIANTTDTHITFIEGDYRLIVDCGGCQYISNIITLP